MACSGAGATTVSSRPVATSYVLHDRALTPTAMAEALAVERSTMSRNLALMEACGWIAADERSPSGRAMTVAITAAGTKKPTAARAAWMAAQATLVAALGTDAARTLDKFLHALHGGDPRSALEPSRGGIHAAELRCAGVRDARGVQG